MQVKDQEVYDSWKAKNSDPYGAAVFHYLEAWADLMEQKLEDGELLENIAEATSHEADTEGITGFMYGCAVSVLVQCWIHGERLRRWHNKKMQIGDEGDRANESGGVLNPALLNISG